MKLRVGFGFRPERRSWYDTNPTGDLPVSRLLPAVLLVPVAAMAAPALKDRPSKEPPSIVGEWERVSRIDAGKDRGPDREPHRQTFKADGAWDYTYGGRED
jgi:hypothetical protein